MTPGPVELSEALGRYMRENRAAILREQMIQDGIAVAFGELGIEADREFRLTDKDRLDFLTAGGIAVEVKKGTAKLPCLRQVGRYLRHPRVKGCIIVAMRCHKIPETFLGKPIATIELWRMLM